ncbi:hypothetical protein AK88_03949 [Plasmodium fragile]|uniref:Uncharacterized protein n=1 Tax=Plasmodium fragile TaxID=5857 RepID=A0A0D9QKY4_PLAFR|nr:uncharacterized protein AK88_03949 [Plasmodium fragile]KJP86396.1 hypothetical protein AK88_03949 [Plasmodium fragile]
MYFNGNEKGIHNNGLIYTSVEKLHIADLKEASRENARHIDYLHFLSKKKRLHKLEKLINSHAVNTQVVVTNFADDAEEVINCEYMHQSVWKNKMCFFLKNVYLSSFFSSEYVHDIVKEYQPRVISLNCKYDNKIYMSGSSVYLCVNDLTKLRLTSHRNVYRDRFKLSNVVVLDICGEGKTENGKTPNRGGVSGPFPGGESTTGDSKLREKYQQFFTDMYTYPVDLVGLYNHGTDHEKFSKDLKNVLTRSGSKDADVYAVPVKCHECFYNPGGRNVASNRAKGDGPRANHWISVDKHSNVCNNEMDSLSHAFNMNSVADIYSSIFPNSSVNENEAHVNSLVNMYNMYGGQDSGLDVVVNPNHVTNSECRQNGGNKPVGMTNQFNYLDIQGREKIGAVHPFYELNAGYIEREFLSCPTRDGKVTLEGNNGLGEQQNDAHCSVPLNPSDVVDLYDLVAKSKGSKKKKTYSIHDKTFYINYDSESSSDLSLSGMLRINCGAANGAATKGQTGGSTLHSSTDGGIFKNYLKGDDNREEKFVNREHDTQEGGTQNCIQSENEKKKKKTLSEKGHMEMNCGQNDHSVVEEAKLRKIDKVLDFLKNHRNAYYRVNERVLQRERLYDIMSCDPEEEATRWIANGIANGTAKGAPSGNTHEAASYTKIRQDEIANYLVEYIGRILLDIKINHKENAHMLIKQEKNFYQVQKIILSNGIISSCCIRDICNFLIGQLVNRKATDRRKLCYVVSFWGQYCSFIHFDKPSQEMCSQTCIHVFFVCTPEAIYITMVNTQDRVF